MIFKTRFEMEIKYSLSEMRWLSLFSWIENIVILTKKLKGTAGVFKVCNYCTYDYNIYVSNQPTKMLLLTFQKFVELLLSNAERHPCFNW